MGENDILTLFEMVGIIGVDMRDVVKSMTQAEDAAKDAVDGIDKRFRDLERDLQRIDLSADVNVDDALKEIDRFKRETSELMKEIEADATIAVDSDQALRDLQRLKGQLERMEIKVESGNLTGDTSASRQQQRVLETMENITRNVRVTQTSSSQADAIQRIARNIESVISGSESISTTIEQANTNNNTFGGGGAGAGMGAGGQSGDAGITAGEIAAAVLAERALDGSGGDYRRYDRDTYDLDRSLRWQEQYQRKMLRYAQKLTASYVLPRVTQSLNMGTSAMPYLKDAKSAMQMQATFGMAESGITSARTRLSQLGFGRTKTELKAIEGQLHMIANTRMDTLKDNIKLTEKALKDMKKAANAHEYAKEIEEATDALKRYKSELADINITLKAAETEGFKAYKWADKDIMVKEYKTTAEKVGGQLAEMLTRPIGAAMNETYNRLDKAGIDIVGDQGTKMENKAKVTQLAGQFQMLGTTMMTVAPILGILAAGIAMVGKTADEAASNLQRTQLLTDEETAKYRESMQRTSVATNSDLEDVSKVYEELIASGNSGQMLERKAETGLNFESAMGVDASQAIAAVEKIQKQLGVTEDDARNILALSLKEYNGDLKTAEAEVLKHKQHWKEIKDTQIDGVDAYTKMTKDSETLWEKMSKAARAWGTALDVIWTQLNEVLGPILDKLQEIGLAAAEWLSEHKTAAKWIGVIAMLTAGFAALSAVLLPVMGFLLMNRNVFQAIGQGLALMGKGTAIVNPQAKMLLDSMTRMRNGLLGMPRLIGALGPAFMGMLKGGPMMFGQLVGTFLKLNPLLSMFGIIALLVFKNIDEYRPALESIQESFGRIIKAIAKAFGGDATTTTSAFNSIIQKLADVAATVLVPAFELFAKVLEKVADWMENGGAEITVFIGKWLLLASVIGGVLKGIGGLKGIFSVIISPLTKIIALLKTLKTLWPGKKIKAEVTTTNKTSGTTANTARVNTQRVSANTVYVNGRVVNAPGGNTPRTTASSGRGGTVVTTQPKKRNKPLRTPNGERVPIPTVVQTPYVGRTTKPPRTTRYTHDEIPKEIRATEPQPRSTRTGPAIVTTRDTHDEIPDAIRTPKEKTKSKKPKPAASDDPHSEIPDAIRVGKGKKKPKGATPLDAGEGAKGGISAIIAGLVGSEIIEAILDLNTKKAEKNMEDFLKNTQEKIEELGGGGEEGSALKEALENLLNGDIGEIDPDSFGDIKAEITEQMQGIFGDDVFDKVKAKVPGRFKKFFGFIAKVVGKFAGFLTGPIGGILLTILPLIWEFREPIMKALKKIGEYLPQGLVNGIKAGWKWLKGIGKWFYDKVIAPIKKFFGIASPSRVMARIGRWIVQGLVNGVKATLGLLKKIVSAIAKPFKSLASAFKRILSSIKRTFSSAFKSIYNTVRNWMSKARKVALNIGRALANGLKRIISGIKKVFVRVFRGIYTTIRSWLSKAKSVALRLIRGLVNGVRRLISGLRSFFTRIFRAIYNTIKSWLSKAKAVAIAIMTALRNFIHKILVYLRDLFIRIFRSIYQTIAKWLKAAWAFIKRIFTIIKNFIVSTLKKIWAAIKYYFKKLYESVKYWLGKALEKVKEIFGKLKDYMVKLAKDAYQWGVDVIRGIWEGMKSKAKDMLGWLFKLGDWIAEAFKKAMDINSPSRVMYALARWIPAGIAKGIEDHSPKAVHAAKQMAKNVTKGVKTDLTADDIMQNVVNSKRAKTTYSLSRAAKANTTPSSGTRTLGNTVIQKMEVHNHTERAARAFDLTMQSKMNNAVRRKQR